MGRALRVDWAAAYLGAVAYDAPYYLDWGRSAEFTLIGEKMHGSHGEDTFVPLRTLAGSIASGPEKLKPSRWAFLLGMASHAATDIVFHPVVYYLTGHYADPNTQKRQLAQQRHRLFETYLDLWFKKQVSVNFNGSIATVVSELSVAPAEICEIFAGTDLGEADSWNKAIYDMAELQRRFVSPLWGAMSRLLSKSILPHLSAYDALFAFGRSGSQLDCFESAIAYRNPVTGEERSRTVLELRNQAVEETVALLSLFEPLLSDPTAIVEGVMGQVRGRSLNVGVYGAAGDQYRYFSERGFDLPGLVQARK